MKIIFAVMSLVATFVVAGCAGVKPYQKERLTDRIMVFDYDVTSAVLKADILTAREGSFGGLSSASAGGCSCK